MRKIITLLFIVFISKLSVAQQDAALAPPSGSITSPVSGCALTSNENVTIRIFNYGPGSITSSFDVSYTINGGIPVTETVPAPNIPQNTTFSYTFATKADLSVVGTYTIDATVSLAGDPTPGNNTYSGYIVNSISSSIGGSIIAPAGVCISGNTGFLSLNGQTGNVVGWQYSTDGGGTWINISNTSTVQSYNNLSVPTSYRVEVKNGACASTYSSVANIAIDPVTVAGTVTGGTTVCVSGNSGTLTSGGGRVGTVQKWQYSTDGGTTWNDTAVAASTLGFLNIPSTRIYRAVVASGSCSSLNSSTATVTVNPATVGGTLSPATITVCSGESGVITLSGYTGSIVRWQYSINGGTTWTNITNTTTTQAYNNITVNTLYRAVVQSLTCGSVNSATANITVEALTVAGTLSGAATVCSGTNSGSITLAGNTGTVQYWESSIDGGTTWANIANTTTTQAYTNLTATTQYRVNVKNGTCAALNASAITITVNPATVGGTLSPATTTVCSGSNGAITLSGNTGAVQRWEFSTDGGTTWTNITNTTTTLNYTNITANTIYRAVVKSGVCAAANSSTSTISVDPVTVAGTLSGTATECSNSNSGILTLAGNTGAVQSWEYSTNGGTTWTNIANTATTHSYTNLTTTTQYRVNVKNGVCAAAKSNTITITVNPVTVGGTLSPATATVCSGSSGTVTLSGNTGAVQRWEFSTDGGTTWTNIANTTTTLNYTNITVNTIYRALLQSGICTAAYSATAAISIDPPTVAGTLSGDTTVCSGANSGILTLAGNTGAVQSWEYSTNGGTTWTNIANTATTHSYTNLTTTTQYRVNVKNGACAAVKSNTITITVNPVTVGGTLSPATASVCSGSSGTITLSGNTGTVQYWEFSTDGGTTWTNIANITTTLNYTNITVNTIYRVVVQSGSCASAVSATSSISVGSPTVSGTLSGDTTVCSVGNSGIITLSGNTGAVQNWEFSIDGGTTWTNISNTTTTHSYTNLTQTTQYRANIKNGACPAISSNIVTITVDPVTVGGTLSPATATVCTGSGGTVTLSGYTGTIQNWESSTDSITWTAIANATASHAYTNLTATTYYRVIVKSGVCSNDTSAVAKITVLPVSVGGAVSSNDTVCYGNNNGTLTLSGNTGNVIRWEYSIDAGATYINIINTAATHTFSNITTTTIFRAVVKNGSCAEVASATATVVVSPISVGGNVAGSTTVCGGLNSGTLFLTGKKGTVQNWESSVDSGATWLTINNITTTLTYSNIVSTTFYRALVKSGACSVDTSSIAVVSVQPASVGGTLSGNDTVCKNANSGALTVSGYTGTIQHWEYSTDGGISWYILGNTTASQSYLNLSVTTSYRVFVKNGSCNGVTSTVATVRVEDSSVAGTVSKDTTYCDTLNSGILTLSGHTGPILNWEYSVDGGTVWITILSTIPTLPYTNLTQTTQYRAVIGNKGCGYLTSAVATIEVFPKAEGGILPANATLCAGNSGIIHLTGYSGSIAGWQTSADNGVTWSMVTPANTTDSLAYTNIQASVTYRVLIESGTCSKDTSTITTLTVNTSPVGGNIASAYACGTVNNGTLKLTGSKGTIQSWEISTDSIVWTPIPNTTDSLQYTNLTATTYYRVLLTTAFCGNDTSAVGAVYVSPVLIPGTLAASTTVCEGTNGGTIRLTGYSGTIESWKSSVDNGTTWVTVNNITDSLVYSNLVKSTIYHVKFNSGGCMPDTSNHVTITVVPQAVGGTVSNVTACDIINSGTIKLTGAIGNVDYWEQSTDNGVTWIAIPVSNDSLPYTNISSATLFRVVISTSCSRDTSTVGTFTISPKAIAGVLSAGDTVCEGNNAGTIHLTGYSGTTQWLESTDGGVTWNSVVNTTDSLVYANLAVTTSYRVVASYGVCTDSSNITNIMVNPFAIGGIVSNVIVCDSINSGTITLTGSVGKVNYWQQSIDNGVTWITIPVTNDSLPYTNISNPTLFRVVISTDCSNDTSTVGTFTIVPKSVAGVLSVNDTVCTGSNKGTLYLTGYFGNLKWIESTDAGANWTSIANTTDSLIYTNLTTTTLYKVIVQNNSCNPDTSNAVTIFVNPLSAGGTVTAGTSACSGKNEGSVTVSGYVGSIIRWESSIDAGATWTAIPNTTNVLTYTNLAQATEFRAIVQSGKCSPVPSASSVVTIIPGPMAQFSADTVCAGNNMTFTNTSSVTSGFIVNTLWNFGDGNTSLAKSPVHNYTVAGSYDVELQLLSNTGCRDTIVKKVLVNPLPPNTIVSGSGKFELCHGDSVLLLASSGNYSYLWNGSIASQNIMVKTSGGNVLQIKNITTGCSSTNAVNVTVHHPPVVYVGNDTIISLGHSVKLNPNTNVPISTWTWYPATGLDDPSSSSPVATPLITTKYSVLVIDVNGCTTISTINIGVKMDYNVIVSNLITPNGDGFNDTWIIQNIENYSGTKITVLTRQGEEVFSSDSYDNTWNGTQKDGKPLADGAYYYVIKFKDDAKVLKGAVTILKQDK